ncbi:protein Flattop [Prorops nasuta]|uniref:protein Flattop n=1 Tax=Prorops nasuta TaxID=863751 RepID=UPI0034CEC0E2
MSQHLHGHWIEENYKPCRLCNWTIPKWYPTWPDQHFNSSTFIANDRGHLFEANKSTQSPWGCFKGTWDLPKKISLQIAKKLSSPLEYQQKAWETHLLKNNNMKKKHKLNFVERRYELEEVESAKKCLEKLRRKENKSTEHAE